MFILKKIISAFLNPLPLSLMLSFLGLYFLWFTNKQKAGKILVSVGLVILTLFSYSALTNKLLRPLERQYGAFDRGSSSSVQEAVNKSAIKFVVVLAGGHTSDPEVPLISQIGKDALVRLMEGIRIYRGYPDAKLLLSGGGSFDPVSEAEIMARIVGVIGVPEKDIILESRSKDTRDEALFIKPIVGSEPFVLVTSAYHIPRSMALFRKLGMNPISSPVGHNIKDRQGIQGFNFHSLFPNSDSIRKAELAIHEYLGLIWAKLRGQQ